MTTGNPTARITKTVDNPRIPFITDETRVVGRMRSRKRRFFDVPEESYGDGWITGMVHAQQFMAALQRGDDMAVLEVLREASEALADWPADPEHASRRGAGAGFLRMIEAMLRFAAERCNHQAFIQGQIDEQVDRKRSEQEREANERLEFVQRMKAAREAKRLIRASAAAAAETA